MFFTKEYLAANRNMAGHWSELWANRGVFNTQNELMVNQYRHTLTPEMLAANAVQGAAHNMRVTDCVMDGYALEFIDNTATSDTDNLAVKVVA